MDVNELARKAAEEIVKRLGLGGSGDKEPFVYWSASNGEDIIEDGIRIHFAPLAEQNRRLRAIPQLLYDTTMNLVNDPQQDVQTGMEFAMSRFIVDWAAALAECKKEDSQCQP